MNRSTGSQAIKNQSCESDTHGTLHKHSHLILNVLCKIHVPSQQMNLQHTKGEQLVCSHRISKSSK